MMNTKARGLALFSGGLDSILAARLLMEQGIDVLCVHFTSPFFGSPECIPEWEQLYGLHIVAVDLGENVVDLLRRRPVYGFGKVMNPCVDCKILMMRTARQLMDGQGASFLISGEVLGQRPMSQRRDTLSVISRDADVRDVLLRPLSALHLPPTAMESAGIVDRTRLLGLYGRGRKGQLELADHYGLQEIPTPAGGCRLTDRENACRYWPVLTLLEAPCVADFELANVGRQFWAKPLPETADNMTDIPRWLCIGRNRKDNEALARHVRPGDVVFRLEKFPGPLALGRFGTDWSPALLADAAAFFASFAPRAVIAARDGQQVVVQLCNGDHPSAVPVVPSRTTPAAWGRDAWEIVREQIRKD